MEFTSERGSFHLSESETMEEGRQRSEQTDPTISTGQFVPARTTTSSQDSQTGSSIYTPLDKITRSIRLLRFTESALDSAGNLHFTLTVHKLPTDDEQAREDDQRISFMALSYVWGKAKANCSIIVNGKPLKIRDNLHALLQELYRKPLCADPYEHIVSADSFTENLRGRPYLWADAICIDQGADEEKNHQVNMMGDIYSRADCVVAWLGPAADESDYAMYRLRHKDISTLVPGWDSDLAPYKDRAVYALLDRPYWQRLWTVQEFVLAKKLILLCGRAVLPMDDETVEQRIQAVAEDTAAGHFLDARDEWTSSRKTSDLHCMIPRFMRQRCEYPQDRVFAFLGLCDRKPLTWRPDIPKITADYKATLKQIFYRVLAHCSTVCNVDAEREMQHALNLPNCKVETDYDASRFIENVTGLWRVWRLRPDERRKLQGLTVHELIEKRIIRERTFEEVTGHIEKLTGLTREDMENDREGTYLEILGRLYTYYRWYKVPGFEQDTAMWETFDNILRRTLGIPAMQNPVNAHPRLFW